MRGGARVSGLAADRGAAGGGVPGQPVANVEYLRWLYQESPFGPVIETNLDDERGRAGHYALVPITLARDGVDHPAALSLEHRRSRAGPRRGVFVGLGARTIERGGRAGRRECRRGRQRELDPGLRAAAGLRARRAAARERDAAAARDLGRDPQPRRRARRLAGRGLGSEVESLLAVPARGEARRWTVETLRVAAAPPGRELRPAPRPRGARGDCCRAPGGCALWRSC